MATASDGSFCFEFVLQSFDVFGIKEDDRPVALLDRLLGSDAATFDVVVHRCGTDHADRLRDFSRCHELRDVDFLGHGTIPLCLFRISRSTTVAELAILLDFLRELFHVFGIVVRGSDLAEPDFRFRFDPAHLDVVSEVADALESKHSCGDFCRDEFGHVDIAAHRFPFAASRLVGGRACCRTRFVWLNYVFRRLIVNVAGVPSGPVAPSWPSDPGADQAAETGPERSTG